MNRFQATVGAAGLLLSGLAPASAAGETPPTSTWVVDRDGVQCSNADFTTIQAAVEAAHPGDLIRVCPDIYPEQVTVDKPLALVGDPEAVEAVDCFDSTPPLSEDADPARQVIIDPPADEFTVAFRLTADSIELAGFVIQGASLGVDASDRYSGYRIHHNLIRLNDLFGVDFGSHGARESRVDHNCLRDNPAAIVSELDDDSLWKPSPGPERDGWNARDLINARIDHNLTTNNGEFLGTFQITGPGRRERVTIDHNTSRHDFAAVLLQNSTDSIIAANDISGDRGNSIVIGGGNKGLVIAANRVRDGRRVGLLFTPGALDSFPFPNRGVIVTRNEITDNSIGIDARPNTIADSEISENRTNRNQLGMYIQRSSGNVVKDNEANDNRVTGIHINTGNTGNLVHGNLTNGNGVSGITAFSATGNTFTANVMHGNGWRTDVTLPRADARDLHAALTGSLANDWIQNVCDTDIPAGLICGVG